MGPLRTEAGRVRLRTRRRDAGASARPRSASRTAVVRLVEERDVELRTQQGQAEPEPVLPRAELASGGRIKHLSPFGTATPGCRRPCVRCVGCPVATPDVVREHECEGCVSAAAPPWGAISVRARAGEARHPGLRRRTGRRPLCRRRDAGVPGPGRGPIWHLKLRWDGPGREHRHSR